MGNKALEARELMADLRFPAQEAQAILKNVCENQFRGLDYDHRMVTEWANAVSEQSLQQLQALGRPFKFIVNCVIVQNSNAGLNIATSVFWDSDRDGSTTYKFDGKTMSVIATCYGLGV